MHDYASSIVSIVSTALTASIVTNAITAKTVTTAKTATTATTVTTATVEEIEVVFADKATLLPVVSSFETETVST
jgi:hypothetical protein